MDIDLSINPEETSIIIKDFIKTYVENSESKSIVLGLSGGIDSAVTALLCNSAIGKKNTKCVFLPDGSTPYLDIKHLELFVKKFDLLCELNVVEQVLNTCHTTIVQRAWKSGQELAVHGWIYSIENGILKDLNVCIANSDDISQIHKVTIVDRQNRNCQSLKGIVDD